MATTPRLHALRKAIAQALLTRDRLEIKAIERLLTATKLERPVGRARRRPPRRRLER
jgi:hypothetical protein